MDIDEIAVERAAHGERLRLTRAERDAVAIARRALVVRLTRAGWSGRSIAEYLGITRRQVVRHRASGDEVRDEAA